MPHSTRMVPPTQHVSAYMARETKTNCQLILNASVLFERLHKFCYSEMMLTCELKGASPRSH